MQRNGSHSDQRWAPILGDWKVSTEELVYSGGAERFQAHGQQFPMGLIVSDRALQHGRCRVNIKFTPSPKGGHFAGGLAIGYRTPERYYVQAQLGAGPAAYTVSEFVPGFGWKPVYSIGPQSLIAAERQYNLEAEIRGQEIRVSVDGVQVLEALLSRPLEGKQTGLIAAGEGEVHFSGFQVEPDKPRIFVAMEYGEPFETLYEEVIRPRTEKDFIVVNMKEKAGPGVIFQDMQREIAQADVVIAEVTPANPNVYYELGYAHALGKPTVLLAQRGRELPFDISSFRVVFYDDTIGGTGVEDALSKHLDAIRQSVG